MHNKNWSVKHTQNCLSFVPIVLLDKTLFWFILLTKMLTKTFIVLFLLFFKLKFPRSKRILWEWIHWVKKKKMVQTVRSWKLYGTCYHWIFGYDPPTSWVPLNFPFCWLVPSYSFPRLLRKPSFWPFHAQLCVSFLVWLVLLSRN